MEALFIVPAMVSPNVNPRLIPALSKMIERNIIMTNSAVFRTAALRKYSGFFKTARSESSTTYKDALQHITEQLPKLPVEDVQKTIGGAYGAYEKILPKPLERLPSKGPVMTEPEKIEVPHGIQFFTTISLEPTALTIPISIKGGIFGGPGERVISIGVKCVPYAVKGVDNVIAMMKYIKSLSMLRRYFFSKWNRIKTKIPFTLERQIQKGLRHEAGLGIDIVFAPNSTQLSKPNVVMKLMSARTAAYWSTLAILSTFDFKEEELREMLNSYRDLVSAGWGDMVVVNDAKESVNFCTTKMSACFEWPMAYIKAILNLSNVLDYSEVSRWSKPFSVSSIAKALRDNVSDTLSDKINSKILGILKE